MIHISKELEKKKWISYNDIVLSEIEGLIEEIDKAMMKAKNFIYIAECLEEDIFIKSHEIGKVLRTTINYEKHQTQIQVYFDNDRY